MNIDLDRFRIQRGEKVNLKNRPSDIPQLYASGRQYKSRLAAEVKKLRNLQRLLYAANSYSILLIFQAMDAAGKDGSISHVLTGVNPQGCEVYSFKHPSAEELEHDFLWRTTRLLPSRGRICVFNRSYYEEVLIVRVHPDILRDEGIPGVPAGNKSVWRDRYRSITDFERHLELNGTRIIKIFLNISKEEQRKRFIDRIDDPDKNWKFSQADVTERRYWKAYMKAYEACLQATSTAKSPWIVVPADDKRNARLIITRVMVDALQGLKLKYPRLTKARRKELAVIRRELA